MPWPFRLVHCINISMRYYFLEKKIAVKNNPEAHFKTIPKLVLCVEISTRENFLGKNLGIKIIQRLALKLFLNLYHTSLYEMTYF